MLYRLIVLNGPCKGQRLTVDPESVIIGREEQCALCFADEEMALRHARIEQRGNELFISDLGSMNKIIVNKHQTTGCRIKHGDIIEIGRTRLLIEALVQAEVQVAPSEAQKLVRKGVKRKLAIAASVLLIGGATFAILQTDTDEALPEVELVTLKEFTPPILPPSAVVEEAQEPVVAGDLLTEEATLNHEIKQLREDLAFIQEHLQQLNNSALVLAAPQVAPESVASAEIEPALAASPSLITLAPVDDKASGMKAARDAMAAADYDQADMILEHLQIEFPDHLPAYELRAEVFEQLNLPARARDQWTAILQRTTESGLYRRAVTERIRLGRAESQQLISAHDAVRIQSIDQIRFRQSAEYDEMRTVKVNLHYDRSLGPIDPVGVRLMVYFFEQDLDTRRINLSKAQPYAQANLSALQQDTGDLFTCAVSYVAPKGYYTRDHNTSRQRYYGFIARLHYFENLVDEQARPAKLLDPAVLEAAGLAMHTAHSLHTPSPLPAATF